MGDHYWRGPDDGSQGLAWAGQSDHCRPAPKGAAMEINQESYDAAIASFVGLVTRLVFTEQELEQTRKELADLKASLLEMQMSNEPSDLEDFYEEETFVIKGTPPPMLPAMWPSTATYTTGDTYTTSNLQPCRCGRDGEHQHQVPINTVTRVDVGPVSR